MKVLISLIVLIVTFLVISFSSNSKKTEITYVCFGEEQYVIVPRQSSFDGKDKFNNPTRHNSTEKVIIPMMDNGKVQKCLKNNVVEQI